MDIKWNWEKLSDVFRTFSNVCNVNISIVNKDMEPVNSDWFVNNAYCEAIQKSKHGKKLCTSSDRCLFKMCDQTKSAQMHMCHAGLIDIAIPIVQNDEILGYIILGQIKCDNDFNNVIDNILFGYDDISQIERYYNELPLFDYDKIQSMIKLSSILSEYIALKNMYFFEKNDLINLAEEYIIENLDKNISIEVLVRELCTSKTTLYRAFKNQYNLTPGEYINIKRVRKSESLLVRTNDSIEKISETVGFSAASYYSKVFKKIHGISPLKSRKQNR